MRAGELPRPVEGSRGASTMAAPATIPPPPPASADAWRFPLPPSAPPAAASPAGKVLAFLVLAIALTGFGFALSTPAISVAGIGALALGVLICHTLPVGVWFEKVSGWVAATVVVIVYLVVAGAYGAVTRTVPPLQPAPFLGLAVVGMDFQRADRLRPSVFLSVLALLPLIGTETEAALVLAMIWLGVALCALWILQGDTDRGQRRAQPVRTPADTTGEELPLSGSELLRILGSAALISLALVLVIGNPSCSSTGSRISVMPTGPGRYGGGAGGLDPDSPFVDPGDIGGGIPGGGIPGGAGDAGGSTGEVGGSTGEVGGTGGTGGDVGGVGREGGTGTGGRSGNSRSDSDSSGGGSGGDSPAGGGGGGNGGTGSGREGSGPGSGDGNFGDATPSSRAPNRNGPGADTDSPGRDDANDSTGRGNAGTSGADSGTASERSGPGGGATRSGGGAGERSSGSGSAAPSGPGVPDADTRTDLTPLLLILLCVGVIIAALVVGAMLFNKLGDHDDDDDEDELTKPRRRWFSRRRPPTPREWGRATIARLIEEGERRGRPRPKSETIARYCAVLSTEVIAEPRLVGVARVLDDALYGAGDITGEEMAWVDNVLDQIRSLPTVQEPEAEADRRPMAAV